MKRSKTFSSLLTLVFVFALCAAVFANEPAATEATFDSQNNSTLIKLLKDKNLGIRTSAAQLLAERKSTEAVQPLTDMLKWDNDSQARIIAATTLLQIGNKDVLETVKLQAQNDMNKTVRTVLAGIVQKMEK